MAAEAAIALVAGAVIGSFITVVAHRAAPTTLLTLGLPRNRAVDPALPVRVAAQPRVLQIAKTSAVVVTTAGFFAPGAVAVTELPTPSCAVHATAVATGPPRRPC